MKLRELADVKQGLTIAPQLLRSEKKVGGIYFPCLRAEDFTDGKSYFVPQKEFKHIEGFSRKSFLFYGDYILLKKQGSYKLLRYEGSSGQTIACNGLIVITPDLGILKDYFTSEKNKKAFCEELLNIERIENGKLPISKIGEIEIGTDNIFELENANIAEQIGIRNPIKFADVPFNIYEKPLPFDKLLKRINAEPKELLLDTEFQRRPGLWDVGTKSRLIESMIIRLPIPAFYFDGSNDNEWLVIDGLQRLSAVNDFVNNEYVLSGLDYLPELENKSFSELDRIHQRNIEEFVVFAYIIQKGTPKAVTYKIFKNINTSALKLEPQEIRHALNPGSPAVLLKTIAEKAWFKKGCSLLTDRQKDRMEDRETVLRFISFQISSYTEYSPTIVDFLDTSMTKIYEVSAFKQNLYEKELENIFSIVLEVLGEKAFSRALFDDSRSYGLNNIMFELITYGISIVPNDKRKKLSEPSTNFKQTIINHFSDKKDSFWEYENAYTRENLRKRFEEIELMIRKILQ